MAEESATPDLVELTRRAFNAATSGDLDAMMSVYAPDAVLKLTGMGTSFEGLAAIRTFWEDWFGAHEEIGGEAEEILDLGNGVTFAWATRNAVLLGAAVASKCAREASACG
jgi:ketosteroid isomerase-like protein